MYCRQSYKVLKPACVFPIEVELQLEDMPSIKAAHDDELDEDTLIQSKSNNNTNDSSDEEMLSSGYEETQGKEEKVTDDLISI